MEGRGVIIGLLKGFRKVPATVFILVAGELFLHLVNAAFFLILNVYLAKQGYADEMIASFTSSRFLGVMLLALPFGMLIRGRPLKPFLLGGAVTLPLVSILVLETTRRGHEGAAQVAFLLWGSAFMLVQVSSLPFIMRAARADSITESFTLAFSTWSVSSIITGALIGVLGEWGEFSLGPVAFLWDEYHILLLFSVLGLIATPILLRLREPPLTASGASPLVPLLDFRRAYDWNLIGRVVAPTVVIAVGAGLTIPFINLFFFHIFDIDSDVFSLFGSVTAGLCFFAAMLTPAIKRRFGFKTAILGTQTVAIAVLALLGVTEIAAARPGMVYVALGCYIFRQPLMHMAGPLTSELTMSYVGEKNRELISALNSSIWSGSWFLSAKLFQIFRAFDMAYWQIIHTTALLYICGVLFYRRLIISYEKGEGGNGTDPENASPGDIPVAPITRNERR